MKLTSRYILFLTVFAAALLVLVFTIHYITLKKSEWNTGMVTHTYQVMNSSRSLIKNILDAEALVKEYVLSKDSATLNNYKLAQQRTVSQLIKLKDLTADNVVQESRLDSLNNLSVQLYGQLGDYIRYSNDPQSDQRILFATINTEKKTLDHIRAISFSILKEEEELLINRNDAANVSERNSLYTLFAGGAVSLGLLCFLCIFLYKENKKLKDVEQELFIRSEWYTQTLVSLGDGVIATDKNGIITLINKSAENISGWKKEEAIGIHIDYVFQITNERTGNKVINPAIEAMQRNQVVLLANHTILKMRNGNTVFIDDSGAPIHNDKGDLIGAVLVFRDITEKKKAEDALRELNQHLERKVEERTAELLKQEIHYKATLDKMLEGIQIIGYNWRYLYANDSLMAQLGTTKEEFFGKNMLEEYPGIEKTKLFAELEECMTKRISGSMENEFVFPSGEHRWYQLSIQPVPEGLFVLSVDITKRKDAEMKIEESEEKFRSLVENITDTIITLDTEFKILFVNHLPAGADSSSLRGQSIYGWINPEYVPVAASALQNVMSSGTPVNYETSGTGIDGETVWYLHHAGPVFTESKVTGIVIIVKDITDRKKAEQILEQQNNRLIKTNTELDRFVYSTSHDLRAPLTSLLGLINITEDHLREDDTEQKERIVMMKKTVSKLDTFIGDILNYSRNARTDLASDTIDFKQIVRECTDHLKYMDVTGDYSLSVNINQESEFVTDKSRLLVILSNMMSNAVKYQDSGKKDRTVDISIQSDTLHAEIRVRDNGIGIESNDLDKIFEMFYRATKHSNGSGLGMYIVKETLTKLNGTISVESTPGAGTCFTVCLPNMIQA
ncbi:MAG: PAS domain S-box protein [Bacteroidia bacterium]